MIIPKIIHKCLFVDDGELPDIPQEFQDAINSWKNINNDYDVKVYSLNDAIQYIKINYDVEMLNYFLKLKPHAFKLDFFTLLVLYKDGGWITGARSVCFESFDKLNILNKEFYVCKDAHINPNCLWNGFTGSIPKHSIIYKYINMIKFNIDMKHYGLDCLYVTGPGVYIQAAIDYIRFNPDKCEIGKHIIDQNNQSYICFKNLIIGKHKYGNKIKPGIFSDIKGGNDYGKMWLEMDVYKDVS